MSTVAAICAAVALLAGCSAAPLADAPAATPAELVEQVAAAGGDADPVGLAEAAADVLDGIAIAPRTEWDGRFDRVGSFGDGWGDPDGNGCDARNDALQQALAHAELLADGCRVASGVLDDPYTGETIAFERGPRTSEHVQIDHVVALYNAWRTGAQDLAYEERVAFANDPLNLQPTAGWANDDKQASDASQWLPPDEDYHCTYVSRQIAVKATYGLWVTQSEHDAMHGVLAACREAVP
ncbi:HNH endonuclease [Pseudoclavibacter endophyticus]|uniref:HNH endonuclease n=2 Tax=Pseudoclavibacter endophyticus TaxID=1778590 RepID=A0A6H9WQM8_9MICO|nr:HNH endonuclease [Pseudoclavibacter endophyticus]